MRMGRIVIGCLIGSALACSHANKQVHKSGNIPEWVMAEPFNGDALCGLGVAGPGYDRDSPYPKQLSEERAVENLAGILGTQIQEAIIDRQDNDGTSVDFARTMRVDDALLQQVASVAKTEFWLDVDGDGPYQQRNFTYAHTCMDADTMHNAMHVDPSVFKNPGTLAHSNMETPPTWLTMSGRQPGGRICAVGYSMPAFFADQTFQTVVDDVRGQLTDTVQTLVSSYYQELSNAKYDLSEEMTVATTNAISKGAIVVTFWHDRDGMGPFKQKLTTYGWGCIYPMDIVHSTFSAAVQKAPQSDKDRIAQVEARAELAMNALDAETAKHGSAPAMPTTTPSTPATMAPSKDTAAPKASEPKQNASVAPAQRVASDE